MIVLVFFTLLASIFFGFSKPYKAAWFLIFFVPLLGPGGLYIGVDTLFPINAYRLGLFMLFGILLKFRISIIELIVKNKYTHIIFLYFIILFILQVRHYPIPTIFTMLPFYALAIILPFILIRSESDIYKLVNIFVLQSVIISSFIFMEFYTDFNLAEFIRQTSGVDLSATQSKVGLAQFRSNFYRVGGLHGNAVQTAYHLIFLFPFTIYYFQYNNLITRSIPILLILGSFFLLQTRAGFVVLFVVITLILFLAFINTNINQTVFKLIGMSGFILICFLSLRTFFPDIFSIAEIFISNLYLTLFSDNAFSYGTDVNINYKLDRIPIAFNYFLDSPIYGHMVSPRYAYYVIMNTDDVPSILLHLIGGGILLSSIYIYMMIKIVFGTYKEIKKKYSKKINDLILYSTAAMFGGFIVTFSNSAENHYQSIFIIFLSIKIYKETISIESMHK